MDIFTAIQILRKQSGSSAWDLQDSVTQTRVVDEVNTEVTVLGRNWFSALAVELHIGINTPTRAEVSAHISLANFNNLAVEELFRSQIIFIQSNAEHPNVIFSGEVTKFNFVKVSGNDVEVYIEAHSRLNRLKTSQSTDVYHIADYHRFTYDRRINIQHYTSQYKVRDIIEDVLYYNDLHPFSETASQNELTSGSAFDASLDDASAPRYFFFANGGNQPIVSSFNLKGRMASKLVLEVLNAPLREVDLDIRLNGTEYTVEGKLGGSVDAAAGEFQAMETDLVQLTTGLSAALTNSLTQSGSLLVKSINVVGHRIEITPLNVNDSLTAEFDSSGFGFTGGGTASLVITLNSLLAPEDEIVVTTNREYRLVAKTYTNYQLDLFDISRITSLAEQLEALKVWFERYLENELQVFTVTIDTTANTLTLASSTGALFAASDAFEYFEGKPRLAVKTETIADKIDFPMTMQFEESDYDFFMRVLSRLGLNYEVRHKSFKKEGDTVILDYIYIFDALNPAEETAANTLEFSQNVDAEWAAFDTYASLKNLPGAFVPEKVVFTKQNEGNQLTANGSSISGSFVTEDLANLALDAANNRVNMVASLAGGDTTIYALESMAGFGTKSVYGSYFFDHYYSRQGLPLREELQIRCLETIYYKAFPTYVISVLEHNIHLLGYIKFTDADNNEVEGYITKINFLARVNNLGFTLSSSFEKLNTALSGINQTNTHIYEIQVKPWQDDADKLLDPRPDFHPQPMHKGSMMGVVSNPRLVRQF